MAKLEIPHFEDKQELFKFLRANKNTLIAQKKETIKHGDGIGFHNPTYTNKDSAFKAGTIDAENLDQFKVKAIINTSNWLDSHKDVHIPGLWDKSLKENKFIMHVKEHKSYEFESIIADGSDLKAYTEDISWNDLGVNATGKSQALVFDSVIKRSRNSEMFKRYANGEVKNHSVGMRYIKMTLCVNDKDYGAEYEAWEKYYPQIINKQEADLSGYFWAITEAKAIEGSAVPLGSNTITPTLNVGKTEPLKSTQDEAAKALQDQRNFYLTT